MKTCPNCKTARPIEMFIHRNGSRRTFCAPCREEHTRKVYDGMDRAEQSYTECIKCGVKFKPYKAGTLNSRAGQ